MDEPVESCKYSESGQPANARLLPMIVQLHFQKGSLQRWGRYSRADDRRGIVTELVQMYW